MLAEQDQTMRGMAPEEVLTARREMLTALIASLMALEKDTKPPVIQEVVLARRSLEDARMRLGVALTYLKEQDPWSSNIKEQK